MKFIAALALVATVSAAGPVAADLKACDADKKCTAATEMCCSYKADSEALLEAADDKCIEAGKDGDFILEDANADDVTITLTCVAMTDAAAAQKVAFAATAMAAAFYLA